jgi:DNA-directed RNA polymerase beta subunit
VAGARQRAPPLAASELLLRCPWPEFFRSANEGRKRIRKSFGRIAEVAPMPNLIEVQKASYDRFLEPVQNGGDSTLPSGLEEAFRSVFPIRDFSGRAQLEFVSYELEDPKYDVEECQQRDMTYAAPLKVTLGYRRRNRRALNSRHQGTGRVHGGYAPHDAERHFCRKWYRAGHR